ncbi:helix-turn-helix transcriptional regulator [Geodermatophilus sabuli]|uniref:Helix-turn-helix transcriptional regulator n=1 Tax=Geodermatophilus sabuli TaxID=1564158 RepID=A0A7K3VV91_9ACTN|nr:LuxR C-terminal-related transcriptional regulator [Geodermatophilus sabuli]NEK56512.1 helix-turn-helix transcriptional regulator [Geodermatophilus sabuli]
MAGPLLATKLHRPQRRRGAVARPRLGEKLDRGAQRALTLVSAPAGFGKTTLLTEWLAAAGQGRSTAWLSLDQRDDDPVVFWTYLITALQATAPGVGDAPLALLQSSGATLDEVLATLVNDLSAVPVDLVLVLDDYHVVASPEVHAGVAFLLDHLPPQVHLVIATRADPALPLARLRAAGELVEVRADDLRFTTAEAAAYLDRSTGLALSPGDVETLAARTEGWIAALQLAALSLQGRDDATGFIAGFAGDDRYVVDYLLEEVLQRQPDDVRDFLLRTSVLGRLTGALCDAVVGGTGARSVLEALDRANLFLVPLDDRRQWYRYHHLFADVLRVRLLDERPELVPDLHRRASGWHARHGEPAEAIRHALAGGDAERAAELVELALPAMRRDRQEVTLSHWLEALPDEVLADRPLLSTTYAGVLLMRGRVDGVDRRLRDAEGWVDAAGKRVSPVAPGGADEALLRRVRGEVAVYRAALARVTGDVAGTITHARRVLDLAGDDDHLPRGSAAGLLGLAHWSRGELETAHRWWSESHASLQRAGHAADALGIAIALADIRIAQGRLGDALAGYERGLGSATAQGTPVLRGTADMHVGMAEVLLERDDLEAARRHLATSAELGEHAGLPQNRHRLRIARARVHAVDGDLDGALALLDEAERLYVSDMFPDVRPIAALRARLWSAQGEADRARGWARERGLSVADELSYLREFEHVTLARVLLAEHATAGDDRPLDEAHRLLERLLQAAEDGGRTGSVIEVLVLRALAQQAGGDPAGAVGSVTRAVALAEPEGQVRVFLDEGPQMTSLLRAAAKGGTAPAGVRRLLAARTAATHDPRGRGPVEPLSVRELELLRLLGTDLDGPGIARELVVSLNTVRTHTRNVYAKLGVNNRRAAVRRGAELDLLSRSRPR